MPHLVIEHSPGLEEHADIAALCAALHRVMTGVEAFPLAGIRVRAHRADHAIVADALPQNHFVALTLSVAAGRPEPVLKAAGEALFAAAQGVLAGPLSTPHFALSLEIRQIDPALSWKDTPIHGRLSAAKGESR